MAIWCLSKTIAYGSTIAAATLVYCYIIILNNRKENEKMDGKLECLCLIETLFCLTRPIIIRLDIKTTNSSSPNKRNKRQIFGKNSANQNNMPELLEEKQIVSSMSKQSMFNNPRKPLTKIKRLHQIQSKVIEYYNSIIHNSARFFTHNESSETIILNLASSEHQDNLKHPFVIYINNSVDLTSNRVQIKVFKSIKINIKTYTSDNPSTNNSSIMISQKSESKEIDIMIPSFSHQRVVERIMTLRGSINECT